LDEQFEQAELFSLKTQELPLSGPALLDLMLVVLAKGLPIRFCARGWSMAPFIRDGDVITVAPLQPAFPAIGEVVAFVLPETGSLVVHRVIARRGAAVLLQGDNGLGYQDGFIPLESLLGRVKRIERNGRRVWLGLGPERYWIAWLSRNQLLIPIRDWFACWLMPFYRRSE
jgi:hypothetical protein